MAVSQISSKKDRAQHFSMLLDYYIMSVVTFHSDDVWKKYWYI